MLNHVFTHQVSLYTHATERNLINSLVLYCNNPQRPSYSYSDQTRASTAVNNFPGRTCGSTVSSCCARVWKISLTWRFVQFHYSSSSACVVWSRFTRRIFWTLPPSEKTKLLTVTYTRAVNRGACYCGLLLGESRSTFVNASDAAASTSADASATAAIWYTCCLYILYYVFIHTVILLDTLLLVEIKGG